MIDTRKSYDDLIRLLYIEIDEASGANYSIGEIVESKGKEQFVELIDKFTREFWDKVFEIYCISNIALLSEKNDIGYKMLIDLKYKMNIVSMQLGSDGFYIVVLVRNRVGNLNTGINSIIKDCDYTETGLATYLTESLPLQLDFEQL